MTDFWLTLIGASATFAMAVATFVTLGQNKKQLNELKRQWQEEHRARVEFSIEIPRHAFYLKVENIGKSVANIQKIEINNDFLEQMSQCGGNVSRYRKLLENLFARPLKIAPGISKYYLLCPAEEDTFLSDDVLKLKSTPIKITFTLDGGMPQEVDLLINDYGYMASSFIVKSGVEIAIKEVGQQLKKIEEKLSGRNV